MEPQTNKSYDEYFEKFFKVLADNDKHNALKCKEDKYKQTVISNDNQFPLYDRLLTEKNKYMISIIIPGMKKLRLAIIEPHILEITGLMSILPIVRKTLSTDFPKYENFSIRYTSQCFKNVEVSDIECVYKNGILNLSFNLPIEDKKTDNFVEFDYES